MNMAKRIILDAKVDYPAACNAMVISQIIYTHTQFNKPLGWDSGNAFTYFALVL